MQSTKRSLLDGLSLLEQQLKALKRELIMSSRATMAFLVISANCNKSWGHISSKIQELSEKTEDIQTTPSTESGETPASEQGKP